MKEKSKDGAAATQDSFMMSAVHSSEEAAGTADSGVEAVVSGGGSKKRVLLGVLCAIGCEVFFGLSTVFTKHATGIASELSLLGWRFLIAFFAIHLCRWTGLIRIDLRGKRKGPLFAIALFSPVFYFLLETLGISSTTASESGAFFASIPVAALLASTLFLRKKPTRTQVVGIGITVIGVLVTVVAAGLEASFSIFGYSMLTLAVLSYAIYCVLVEKYEEYTGLEITYMMLLCGCATFVLLALAEALGGNNLLALLRLPFAEPGFLLAVLYQGIACSILAFFLSNVAIANIGVNKTSSFIGLSTIVSVAAGVIFLNETFSTLQVVGVALILVGVYSANRS